MNNQQQHELTEKLDEIDELKCHYKQLEQLYQTQQGELLQLKEQQITVTGCEKRIEEQTTTNNRFVSTLQEDRGELGWLFLFLQLENLVKIILEKWSNPQLLCSAQ